MVVVPFVGKYFGRKTAYWGKSNSIEGRMCTNRDIGWAKFMHWKFPVDVVISDKGAFRGAGIVAAAL